MSDENPSTCASYKERCNFEQDLCRWTQDTDDDFEWTRDSGGTASYMTGPGRDHTKGEFVRRQESCLRQLQSKVIASTQLVS